jgi:hypothetical protein
VPYHYHRGHITPIGLFDVLAEYNDQTIVLDDVSSIFNQPIALQLLLAALERKDNGEPRMIGYRRAGKDGDRLIAFTGAVIAISNLRLGSDPVLDALKSRAITISYEPRDEEMDALMREVASKGWTTSGSVVTAEECLEVADFLISGTRRVGYRSDIRVFVDKALPDYLQFREGDSRVHWRDLVRTQADVRVHREGGANCLRSLCQGRDRHREPAAALGQRRGEAMHRGRLEA